MPSVLSSCGETRMLTRSSLGLVLVLVLVLVEGMWHDTLCACMWHARASVKCQYNITGSSCPRMDPALLDMKPPK
jgi:hypothetical protein